MLNPGTYVEVVKAFQMERTPCPIIGTVGKFLDDGGGDWLRVEFNLPFKDVEGDVWIPSEQKSTMVIRFKRDEIVEVTKYWSP